MKGVLMVLLTDVLFGLLLVLFSYWMVVARTRRQVLALTLAGVLALALVPPPAAQAQASLVGAIQSVMNVINGLIKTAMSSTNSVRAAISNFYQQVTWPVAQINQAKAMVTQMIGQYRSLMQNIFNIKLNSATLPHPVALEKVMRNHQTNDFGGLTSAYGNTYGNLPTATAASPADRTMMDMDDALAVDNLKTLKASDAADDLTLQAANNIEGAAGQAAPRLAHENALRKRGATMTGDVNTQILNLLQRN